MSLRGSPRYAFVLLIVLFGLISGARPRAHAAQGCNPDLPSRLTYGRAGVVARTANPRALGVRSLPTLDIGSFSQFGQGSVFHVIGREPICADGLTWWQVSNVSADEIFSVPYEMQNSFLIGYIPEGADGEYFVEPYTAAVAAKANPPVPLGPPPQTTTFDHPLPTLTPDDAMPDFGDSVAPWGWNPGDNFFARDMSLPDPLTLTLPDSYAGSMPSLPVDLSEVAFVADADLSDAQLAALSSNGFVVVPGGDARFEDALWIDPATGRSDFITADMMLHNLYWLYRYALMYLEGGALFDALALALSQGYYGAAIQYAAAIGTPLEAAARDALVYYVVALSLLADGEAGGFAEDEFGGGQMQLITFYPSEALMEVDPAILALAQPYIDAARAASGPMSIDFLESYTEDFGLYVPVSHYETSDLLAGYFRAITWLGRINFALNSQADTDRALLVARAMSFSGLTVWGNFADTLAFLIGPMDDLSIRDYLPLMRQAFGDDLPLDAFADATKRDEFAALAADLPEPRVNSLLLQPGLSGDAMRAQGRGFRLMGARYTLDAALLQRLIDPDIPGRALPTTLDLAAAFGSDMAYALVEAAGLADYPEYAPTIAAHREQVAGVSPDAWHENLYGAWLWALEPLFARQPALEPPLMATDAWRRKDLHTGFGSYTELKNATAAYVKLPGGLGGGGEFIELTTYTVVEPNPLVFARASIASMRLADELEARGFGGNMLIGSVIDQARTHSYLSALAAEMARMSIAGEPIPEDWLLFFQHNFRSIYGYVRITLMELDADPPRNSALTAVAATSPVGALQLANGLVDHIYVVTDRPDGTLQLTRGGVYSFYEYLNTTGRAIPDSVWRDQVDAGDLPPRPEWIAPFYVP